MKLRRTRLVFCIVRYSLLLLVAAVLVVAALSKSQTGKNTVFGRSLVWIITDSMADEIPENTFILVKETDTDSIRPGDIITYYSDDPDIKGNLNTHRVIGISEDGKEFLTKGDHNNFSDDYNADREKVIGVYEKKLPTLTYLGRVMMKNTGPIVLVAAFMIILDIMLIPDLAFFLKAKKEKAALERQRMIDEKIRKEIALLKEKEAPKETAPEPEKPREKKKPAGEVRLPPETERPKTEKKPAPEAQLPLETEKAPESRFSEEKLKRVVSRKLSVRRKKGKMRTGGNARMMNIRRAAAAKSRYSK